MKFLMLNCIWFIFLLSCNTKVHQELAISKDLKKWPSPFFGKLISTDTSHNLLYYNKFSSEIQLITDKHKLINSYSYEFNHVDIHQMTFYQHTYDSLFVFQKYLSDIILFDSEGVIRNHFWLPNRLLNHYSNFRNRPAYYDEKVFLTEIQTKSAIDSNACYLKEIILDISKQVKDSIIINLPSDIKCEVGLNAFQFLPLKLQIENKLFFLFPTSNYVIELDLMDYSISEYMLKWNDVEETTPFKMNYTYADGMNHYKKNEKSIHFSYNNKSKEFLIIREDKEGRNNCFILNSRFEEIESYPLNSSCYFQSILPFKEGFVALSLVDQASDSLVHFQDLKSFSE
ncbi:MAG: hypothetical protein ACQETL_00820 [Bacteroidota bacterium]